MPHRNLIDYFNRVAIINLPESRERLISLMAGLQYLGIPPAHPKLQTRRSPDQRKPMDSPRIRCAAIF
jgi:hypothetical protein